MATYESFAKPSGYKNVNSSSYKNISNNYYSKIYNLFKKIFN